MIHETNICKQLKTLSRNSGLLAKCQFKTHEDQSEFSLS